MVEIESVTRKYGTKYAVHELDLAIGTGELFAFLGPNGAGKTTTIKMMTGLLRPSSGMIRIDGQDVVKQAREAKARIGYVPDQPLLYDKLTGREFLQFLGGVRGIGEPNQTTAIETQIELFELQEFVDLMSEEYSHGMKQRLAFSAALLHDPQVLILDEPMVGLDPRGARLMKDVLRRRVESGRTIFMSTHTLSMAEELADRIGVIDQGPIAVHG